LDLIKATGQERKFAHALLKIKEMKTVVEFAPYAVSVLRLFLAFACGLAKGFVGPRPTNYIDLQYLYYSPFCMVFVSNDKFQRDMWSATSGVHSFVWGQELKDDLRDRIAKRAQPQPAPEGAAVERENAAPARNASSIIAEMRKQYLRQTEEPVASERASNFSDLPPAIRRDFQDAMKEFDKMDSDRKRER
jgi:hypothetical protein